MQPLFQVHFLNLEYLFYLIYQGVHGAAGFIDYYLFGGALGTGYVPGGAGTAGSSYGVSNGAGEGGTSSSGGTLGPGSSGESGTGGGGSSYDVGASPGSFAGTGHDYLIYLFKTGASLLAVFFITVALYSLVRLIEIRMREREKLNAAAERPPEPTPKNEQWEKVTGRLDSTNPADWKLAILEADSMLDDMVRRMGYRGENLGERLKAVEPSDFESIQSAWEAHKVRNKIAHEGSGFNLSHREARRIVALYGAAFKEFYYI